MCCVHIAQLHLIQRLIHNLTIKLFRDIEDRLPTVAAVKSMLAVSMRSEREQRIHVFSARKDNKLLSQWWLPSQLLI